MDVGNKEWWTFPKWSDEYERGVDGYIKIAFATKSQGNQICCPCDICHYRYWRDESMVRDHIICNGFVPRMDKLSHLGIEIEQERTRFDHDERPHMNDLNDDIGGLLHDAQDAFREGPNDEAKKFFKLIEEGQEELYPGCKKHSKLSFMIKLFIYKCDHRLTNVGFADLLELFRDVLPDAKLPASFNEAKNVLKVLGLDYTKIDACPNDCMLYWEERANATSCHVCDTPRWKSNDVENKNGKTHRIPRKILRYFPIKKRLQRLFMCQETARYMRWHANGREEMEKDELLQHPSDGLAWKDFDSFYPDFAKDPRNVRLALSTDGFNPFNSMSIVHSTWPVILVNYNLPPWMLMKPEFLMLALLIPGPSSPGNDIDIYLQPLIKDLQDLWEFGLETYDASSNQRFDMRVALMTTISDFPAYAMLSGWSTKGYLACPECHYETTSMWLPFSQKCCFMDARIWLDISHPWRHNKRNFNGKFEKRSKPTPLKGDDIEDMLRDFPNEFGKKQKKKRRDEDDPNPWRKLSIFFKLPYWKHCSNRHNLDAMHIEKNVFDNVIGTLLNIPEKTKDHVNARRDLVELQMMPQLQPIKLDDGSEEIPTSRFWMTLEEKRKFCQVIKNAKLPQGFASNISRCVQVEGRKIMGYKSHDAHFMMNYLLPVAVKTTLPKDVASPLIRLSCFFKGIWKKVIDPRHLDGLQSEIVETLCQFEGIFPPAFFDIMVHLPIHLVEQIKLGGPIASRCMYAIERYLRELKQDVRYKGRPEGSMAEGYQAKECISFIQRFLKQSSIFTPGERNISQSIFPKVGCPIKGKGRTSKKKKCGFMMDHVTRAQAHRYVLFNCDCTEVEGYINEHNMMCVSNQRKRKWNIAQDHSKNFMDWFQEKIELKLQEGQHVPNHIKWLSKGPSYVAKNYTGYSVNGYIFHTMKRDANSVTQNSGVTLTALTHSFASTKDKNPMVGDVNYYGSIQDIIEISYHGHFSVVLFRCMWFHSESDGELIMVNMKKNIYEGEPFIMASQAHQVFFVENLNKEGWHYAIQIPPTELCDGNKRKVSAGRRQLTKYELQRIERLKSNLEKMKAQGAEFFASKILQEKTRGLDLCNELLEEKDDESASECDGGSNEDETIRDMETENLNCGLRQSLRGPSARPKTMGDFVKKNISKEQQHQQVEQVHDNNSTSSAMKVQEQCNLKKQQPPNLPHCEKTQQQKKQIIKSFCSPGSMSAYLQFRKKQVQNNAMARTSKIILNNVPTSRISDEHDDDIAFNEDANEDANEDDNVVGNGCEYDTNLEVEDLCEYRKEASKSKKHRGPTKLTEVHARTKEERQVIILNSLGQPVGPTKEVVNEFKFFLGTLGKDPELAPLNYTDFRILPTHDKIWDYVLEKYMVPEYGKTYVLEAVNASWRCYKCRFKKNHFYAYATNEERWAGKPDTISVPQFQELLDYWQCEQIEEESRINRENRLLLDDVHTMGRKSFAILRHELQQEDPNKHEPSQAKVYKESRKRVPGRTYLTNNEKVEENIAKMDALESTLHEEGSNSKDPYSEVIQDPKRKSRLRLVGKGVTKANLKKRDKNSGFIFPEEFLLSMKTELVQQLAPSVASVILSQLREANPGIDLVIPDFMIPSIPKDASSAPHVSEHNGQSSKSGGTVNQVQGDQNGEET